MSSVKREIKNVNEKKPKEYYLCLATALSNAKISEIYLMFQEYMESEKNIVTLNEIDQFLQSEDNNDILRKHYKLWLESSRILVDMFNNPVLMDTVALFVDIDEEKQFYVETEIFKECERYIYDRRILMLVGPPGVGKTTTSSMLLFRKAADGYTIRYSSNGSIKDIKSSISANKSKKEIVFLDDALG